MTAKTASIASSNSTAAYIQAWATFLSTGFGATAGWTKTSDTGQCAVGSLTVPGAINTSVGYEVWRMADSLQSTAPVYLKLEYGSGAAINTPAIWITIGTGSDGAGAITGVLMARTQMGMGGSSTTAYASYLSGAANRVAFQIGEGYTGTTYSFLLCIERTHDSSGGDTGAGLYVFWVFSSTKYSQYLPFTGTVPAAQVNMCVCTPPAGTGALAPNVNAYPVRCWSPGETFPSLNLVAYISGDFSKDSTYAITGYDGTSRTYIALGVSTPAVGFGSVSGNYLGMRYD